MSLGLQHWLWVMPQGLLVGHNLPIFGWLKMRIDWFRHRGELAQDAVGF